MRNAFCKVPFPVYPSYNAQNGNIVKNTIKTHESGLIYRASNISPRKIAYKALVPPHPGQGMPIRALNGQPIGIGTLSDNSNPKNTSPRIVVMIINNL